MHLIRQEGCKRAPPLSKPAPSCAFPLVVDRSAATDRPRRLEAGTSCQHPKTQEQKSRARTCCLTAQDPGFQGESREKKKKEREKISQFPGGSQEHSAIPTCTISLSAAAKCSMLIKPKSLFISKNCLRRETWRLTVARCDLRGRDLPPSQQGAQPARSAPLRLCARHLCEFSVLLTCAAVKRHKIND